jgi:Domain of unknown function (DUF4349)
MKPFRDDADLAAELRALRPAPRPAFAAELDERAAAGFPRRSWLHGSAPAGAGERLRALSPRRLILSTGAGALAAIAVATVVVVGTESGSPVGPQSAAKPSDRGSKGFFEEPAGAEQGAGKSVPQLSNVVPTTSGGIVETDSPLRPFAPGAANRDIERSAEIVLGADPTDLAEDADEVFDAVQAANGIVLRSSTVEGPAGKARADFDLLIPSANLSDALADISAIDQVRSRQEATADITAPTVGVEERLQDSRARIDGLLGQLAAAEAESEREAVETELRVERRHAAFLRTQLAKLDRRANFSRVSVAIEAGGASPSSGGAWGIDDALHDAGHILAIAAAVTLVSLAVLGPIALIALLAWLAHRAWLRRGRERALG